ncbi:hypothetical protein [Devosia sp. A449]
MISKPLKRRPATNFFQLGVPCEIDLMFERFVSTERDESPDIDVASGQILQANFSKISMSSFPVAAGHLARPLIALCMVDAVQYLVTSPFQ